MKGRTFVVTLLVAALFGTLLALYVAAQGPTALVDHRRQADSFLLEDSIPEGSSYIPNSLFSDAGAGWYEEADEPVYGESGLRAGPVAREQDNPRVGITQINSSTVNSVLPDVLSPGTPVDLCFNVTVDTPDQEYMDRFDVDLPDTWTVTKVYTVPNSGCSVETVAGVETGNVVY